VLFNLKFTIQFERATIKTAYILFFKKIFQ